MHPDQCAAEIYLSGWANAVQLFRLIRQNKRLKSAPRIGHMEQREVIEEIRHLLVGQSLFQHKREQA